MFQMAKKKSKTMKIDQMMICWLRKHFFFFFSFGLLGIKYSGLILGLRPANERRH